MNQTRKSMHGLWSSRWAFILAATGAAVGLGNIWKFPYILGENGGGVFVIFYLICIAIIGVPLLMAEVILGRKGRQNPAAAVANVALDSGRKSYWGIIGFINILAGFLILTYYCVITGWTVDYIIQALSGDFYHRSNEHINFLFRHLIASPWKMIFWQSLVVIATVFIIARGIRRGIETIVKLMFPIMLILLVVLIIYSMLESGHFKQAVVFLFEPDFTKLHAQSALSALGHAFFTLSLATGSLMMYGAYLPQNVSITRASIAIAGADTSIALLAGLAIYPIIFAHGLEPSEGPGLIFVTLPIAFSNMPFGTLFAALFFIMLFFAAFTSSISLLEPSVAWLIETFKFNRPTAATIIGFFIWLIGLGTVFSFNIWQNVRIFNLNIFNFLDYLTANIMLPLGGLFITLFVAWLVKKEISKSELAYQNKKMFASWLLLVRYISPIAILIVFIDFIF